jgi:outer membrane receptor for ferrienterochelin and colicins
MRTSAHYYCNVAAVATALLAPTVAQAQDSAAPTAPAPTPASETNASAAPIVYTPADFARFAPRSALDMVRQIPDFTLESSSGERGLGEASENVLINGQRVSGKSNDAASVLGSIPAASVQRIEIVDGASLNIPGLTGRVANVIATAGDWRFRWRYQGQVRRNVPDAIDNVEFSASGRIGASDVTLSFTNDSSSRGGLGREFVTDANGALLIDRTELTNFRIGPPRLAATLRRLWPSGTVLNLNGSATFDQFDFDIDGIATQVATGARTQEVFRLNEDDTEFELGGDVEFSALSGRIKIVALQSYERTPAVSSFFSQPLSGTVLTGTRTGSVFNRTTENGESVLRGEYSWRAGNADWQFSLEGAYNYLDNASAFAVLQPNGQFVDVPFDGANVFVDEWRAQALLTRGWPLAPQLNAQLTFGGEYSRIRTAGVLTLQFVRPKGSLRLTWTPEPRLTVNVELRRAVGQLSFFDFASSVDLQNGTGSAANGNLVPEQTWRARIQVTRRLGAAGSLTIGGYHEWITDIVDQVPLSATTEGVGNLPRGRRWGTTFSGTLDFAALGVPGARLNFSGELRNSRVRDPLTGVPRRISSDLVRNLSAEFRYDIPGTDLAWGTVLDDERGGRFFRLDEVSWSSFTPARLGVYWEHKDIGGMTARVDIRNMLDGGDNIRRDIYVDRRDGPIFQRERQRREVYPVFVFTLSGSF